MFARIRKALIAGGGAALATFGGTLVESAATGGITEEAVSRAIGLAVAAGVTVGAATYRVPNRP